MNTCFFINRLLSGGAQNTLAAIVNGMYEKGEKVEILAFEPRRNKDITFNKFFGLEFIKWNCIQGIFFLLVIKLRNLDKIIIPASPVGTNIFEFDFKKNLISLNTILRKFSSLLSQR